MSVIITESIVKTQKKYVVQNVSKFPQEKNFLIGKEVLVVELEGTSASVRFGSGARHWIPVRSLIHVQGYEAKSVHAKNADGFVIKGPNALNIEVGTAYLEPTKIDEQNVSFVIDGKELRFPLSIFIKLVRKTVKVKDRKIKKESKEAGIPVSVVEAVAGAIKVPELSTLPSAVTKILPELNIPVLIDQVKNAEVEVFDFNGEVHESITEALLSNEKYIHRLIQKTVMAEVRKVLDGQFNEIRDEHNA